MEALKAAILSSLASGPLSIQEIADAFPDESLLALGKALSSLAKTNAIGWSSDHKVQAAPPEA